MFIRKLLLTVGLAGLATPFAFAAEQLADASATEAIPEIIVSAGFREQPLMTSSGSISVLDAETLATRGARHLEDTLASVPNVNFSVGGSRARFIQMRGVGDLEQFVDPKHYPSVGIVVDGIELSNVATAALLFDTEQVEVLRGPQGTRFGASALGGIINISGRDPGDTFESRIEGGYGNLDSWNLGFAAGGPLTETVGGRFAIRQYQRDGFINNAFLGRDDTHDIDELSARGKLVWDVTPALQAKLTTLYIDADNGYDTFALDNSRTTLSDEPGTDAQEVLALGGDVSYQLGALGTFEFKTTWTDARETYGFDEDWIFRGFCDGVRCDPFNEFSASDTLNRKRDQVSFDVRWLNDYRDWSWVLGAYHHSREETLERRRFGLFNSRYETNRYALYGELELAVSERLTARVGIRGEAFDDDYDDSGAFALDSNDTYWSGEATVEYVPRANTLLYATLSRGAKPGGVNTSATSVQAFVDPRFQPFITARQQFDTETLFNKEIGIKGRYLNDAIALRLSAFHMDRNNAQLESWLWDAGNFIFVGMLDNVDDAENYGVELEVDTRLSDRLTLTSRLGYLETEVDQMTVFDLDLNDFRQLRNRDQTKAPRWQFYFGLNWRILDALNANLSVEGRDDSFFGYYHDQKLAGFALLNASVSYQWRGATVRAWARNLLDDDYAVHGLYFANDPRDAFSVNRKYTQLGDPRVYGFELSYDF